MENKTIEIVISTEELKKAVAVVGNAILPNPIVPAAECLLIEVEDNDTITITGTDTSFSIVTSAECISTEFEDDERSFTVSYKFLSGLLGTLPEAPIIISHFKDPVPKAHSSAQQLYSYGVEVKVDENTYNIPGENPIDFPKTKFEEQKTFDIDVRQLLEGIRLTKGFYVPDDVARPFMSGVRLDLTSALIRIVAFTHTRGAFFETKQKSQVVGGYTIPHKMVRFLSGILDETHRGDVTISVSEKMIKMEYEFFYSISPLVEGEYPEIGRFFRDSFKFETVVNSEEWKNAIKRALIFSTEMGDVTHSFREDKLFLISENNNYQTASEQHILVSDEIPDFDIRLKGKEIMDGVSLIRGAVQIGLENTEFPMYIIPKNHMGNNLFFFFMSFRG